jgi:hypothetical protein
VSYTPYFIYLFEKEKNKGKKKKKKRINNKEIKKRKKKEIKIRGPVGIEPTASRTQIENHATRPWTH